MRIAEENHEVEEDDELVLNTLTILNTNTSAVLKNGITEPEWVLSPSTTPKFRIEHYQLEIDSTKILASFQDRIARNLSS